MKIILSCFCFGVVFEIVVTIHSVCLPIYLQRSPTRWMDKEPEGESNA